MRVVGRTQSVRGGVTTQSVGTMGITWWQKDCFRRTGFSREEAGVITVNSGV